MFNESVGVLKFHMFFQLPFPMFFNTSKPDQNYSKQSSQIKEDDMSSMMPLIAEYIEQVASLKNRLEKVEALNKVNELLLNEVNDLNNKLIDNQTEVENRLFEMSERISDLEEHRGNI